MDDADMAKLLRNLEVLIAWSISINDGDFCKEVLLAWDGDDEKLNDEKSLDDVEMVAAQVSQSINSIDRGINIDRYWRPLKWSLAGTKVEFK